MATDNLVLNGKSIDTLEEIVENFSPDDMLREFRNGVLERWLYNHMEDEKLAQVRSLSDKKIDDEKALNGIIEVFGINIGNAGQRLYETGMCLLEGKDGNERRAVECLRIAANMGCADAQYQLAECWNEGISKSDWPGACKDHNEAISLYRAAAEQGHPDAQFSYGDELDNVESVRWWELAAKNPRAGAACRAWAKYSLGECYAEGRCGVRKNIVKALELYEEATDENDRDVLCWVGDKFRDGEGVDEDAQKAFELYSKAAKEGSLEGQYWLGWCYDTGFGVRENPEKARYYYLKVAGAVVWSNPPEICWAQYRIAEFYRLGRGVSENPFMAYKYYEKSAKNDYNDAKFWLGWCYETAFGVDFDPVLAFSWYHEASEGGSHDAKFKLAECYRYALGVAPDEKKALDLYLESAKHGNHYAQRELGKMYLDGDEDMSIKPNPKLAVGYLEKASKDPDPDVEALRLLGNCYFDGVGQICEMRGEAFKCYQKAAEKGDAKAMFNLARCYQRGWGTRPDKVAAKEWAEKAVGAGDEDVANDAERLLEQLLAQ